MKWSTTNPRLLAFTASIAISLAYMAIQKPGAAQAVWRLTKPTNPIEFWTMAMTIATLGLIGVAVAGLRSLRLAKHDVTTRSQREARACAIARCEEMAHEIISKNASIITSAAAAGLSQFVQSANDVRFDPDASEHVASARAWVEHIPDALFSDCIGLLNRIEAWSMYFTTGVADHDIAFGPCAPVFCSMIAQHYPILLLRRAGSASGKYPNAVMLFIDWRSKLEARQDGIRMESIIQSMEDRQRRRDRQAPLPPPIGTY